MSIADTEFPLDWELDRGDDLIPVTIWYTVSKYYRAQTYGPPENCYPAEGGEITSLVCISDNGEIELSASEVNAIEKYIYENHDYDGGYDD
jgi:hypothetical protein